MATMDISRERELDVRKLTSHHYVGLEVGGERGSPVVLECFLDVLDEPSKKSFQVLRQLTKSADAGKLYIKLIPVLDSRFIANPLIGRAIMGIHVMLLEKGGEEKQRETLLKFIEELINQRDTFKNERVHDMTGVQVCENLAKIAEKVGISKRDFDEYCKKMETEYAMFHVNHYGRQNGVWCTPAYMVNGIKVPELSGAGDWDTRKWCDFIKPLYERRA
jgi:hypothetical protein